MTVFGIITLCTAFSFNFAGIITCRLMLGIFEAGLFPGVIYMLSYWYSRWELQTRICEISPASETVQLLINMRCSCLLRRRFGRRRFRW